MRQSSSFSALYRRASKAGLGGTYAKVYAGYVCLRGGGGKDPRIRGRKDEGVYNKDWSGAVDQQDEFGPKITNEEREGPAGGKREGEAQGKMTAQTSKENPFWRFNIGRGKGTKTGRRGDKTSKGGPKRQHKGKSKWGTGKEEEVLEVRLVTWNIDGFRDGARRLTILSCLWAWEVDIAILTETHLRDEDIFTDPPGHEGDKNKRIFKIKMDNYSIADWHNRDSSEAHIGGGVLILVKHGIVCSSIDRDRLPQRPLSCCSVIVEAIRGCCDPFRLTGVYLPPPPTARVTEESVESITKQDYQEVHNNMILNHLICGDFNTTSWSEEYWEWISKAGAWELNDPSVPTFPTGNTLDKFLILPGTVPFDALMPASPGHMLGEGVEQLVTNYYPAEVYQRHPVSAHNAVGLVLPFHAEPCQLGVRTLSIGGLQQEEWERRDVQMAAKLKMRKEVLAKHAEDGNVERLYAGITRAINEVFQDCFRNKGGASKQIDPFRAFCKYHSRHKDMKKLEAARKEGDKETFFSLLHDIAGEGWRTFLSKMRVSDLTQLFRYIEKRDGRQPLNFKNACSAPLESGNRKIYGSQAKCALLADYFEERFKAPPVDARTEEGAQERIFQQKWDRWQPTERIPGVTPLEVLKAARGMEGNKATGPDNLPVEIFQKMSSLLPIVSELFSCVLKTGRFPRDMLKIYIIPLDKPGKKSSLCASKRPISLISVLAKMLEAVVYHRLLPVVEGGLDGRQYAYRRARGTEMHLLELSDGVHAAMDAGHFAYIASLDIDGAFDKVPHRLLIESMGGFGVEEYIVRYMVKWLRGRSFMVRLSAVTGKFYSSARGMTRGVPQGGVISPLLWLLHFNGIYKRLEDRRRLCPRVFSEVVCQDLVYADDVACVLVHRDAEVLAEAAMLESSFVLSTLDSMGLILSPPKSFNIVISPGMYTGALFRRVPYASRVTNMIKGELDEQLAMRQDFETCEELLSNKCFPKEYRQKLPYEWSVDLKILGVLFNECFSFSRHVETLLARAGVRHGVVSRLARCNWGLENNILRVASEALLVSLTRYCIVVVGSGLYERDFKRLETKHAHVAARRVIGLGIGARIETLLMMAGATSAHNLYILACANKMDRCLRAHNSSIQKRMGEWTASVYSVHGWSSSPATVVPSGLVVTRKGVLPGGFYEEDIKETWLCNLMDRAPTLPSTFVVNNTFYSYAEEIDKTQSFKRRTFNFVGAKSWRDVGLQILAAAGWRPDCAVADTISCSKIVPPTCRSGAPIIIGNIDEMKWIADCDLDTTNMLRIEVRTFYVGGYGFSCSYVRLPSGGVSSQGWIVGWDNEQYPPVFVHEFAVLHGCMLALSTIRDTRTGSKPALIMVSAGRQLEQERLLSWFNAGRMGLESAAAGSIIELCAQLANELECPLVLSHTEWCRVEPGDIDRINDPAGVIEGTRMRLLKGILHPGTEEFLSRIPRIPLTCGEVKARIQARHEQDERETLSLLANIGSVSGKLVTEWGLTRAILKEVTRSLSFNRRMQVTISSIVTGTRFKWIGKGGEETEQLAPTLCRKCGIEEDNISHMLTCYDMGEVPKDEEGLIQFLTELARRTVVLNPQLALPISRPERGREGGEEEAEGVPEEPLWVGVPEENREANRDATASEAERYGDNGDNNARETSVSSESEDEGELGESD